MEAKGRILTSCIGRGGTKAGLDSRDLYFHSYAGDLMFVEPEYNLLVVDGKVKIIESYLIILTGSQPTIGVPSVSLPIKQP